MALLVALPPSAVLAGALLLETAGLSSPLGVLMGSAGTAGADGLVVAVLLRAGVLGLLVVVALGLRGALLTRRGGRAASAVAVVVCAPVGGVLLVEPRLGVGLTVVVGVTTGLLGRATARRRRADVRAARALRTCAAALAVAAGVTVAALVLGVLVVALGQGGPELLRGAGLAAAPALLLAAALTRGRLRTLLCVLAGLGGLVALAL
ncbi:hypothetical protein [Pseudokineococcus sp. 1T1Z-3]|uniref:hypothetical protein n=1 Tax=Pseudokineococcus sp. 1T1Z-3 TaxID=3132745 RepID=UPI0030970BDE